MCKGNGLQENYSHLGVIVPCFAVETFVGINMGPLQYIYEYLDINKI